MFCKPSLNCWLFLKHNDVTHAHCPRLSAHRMKTWPVTWLWKSFKSVLHFTLCTSHCSAISNKERKNKALPCPLNVRQKNMQKGNPTKQQESSTSESGIKTKCQSKIWKMTTAQKEPHCLVDKLLSYILQVFRLSKQHKNQPPCIIAMDEMLVWDDMVSNTTFEWVGATSISLKMTGYEKVMV